MGEQQARQIVAVRSDDRCEIAVPNVCLARRYSIHHRLKRSHGGTWSPANLLAACGSGSNGCHGWVETHPAWAREEGLWLMAGDGEPAEVSVHMRWHETKGWWLLDGLGMLEWDGGPFEPLQLAPSMSTLSFSRLRVG